MKRDQSGLAAVRRKQSRRCREGWESVMEIEDQRTVQGHTMYSYEKTAITLEAKQIGEYKRSA